MGLCDTAEEAPLAKRVVFDTHIHLAFNWDKEKFEDGDSGFPNPWVKGEGEGFHKQWTEEEYLRQVDASAVQVEGCIFVECFNQPILDEVPVVYCM